MFLDIYICVHIRVSVDACEMMDIIATQLRGFEAGKTLITSGGLSTGAIQMFHKGLEREQGQHSFITCNISEVIDASPLYKNSYHWGFASSLHIWARNLQLLHRYLNDSCHLQ